MLVLVCGPSGVGKTTLMRALAAEDGARVVMTDTTRPARPGDAFKTSVDAETFRRRRAGYYWPSQALHGALYGEDCAAIMRAACPHAPEPWLLDMSAEGFAVFRAIPHRRLILLPEGEAFLAATLSGAGRAERLPGALRESAYWQALAARGSDDACAIPCRLGDAAGVRAAARAALARWQGAAVSRDGRGRAPAAPG